VTRYVVRERGIGIAAEIAPRVSESTMAVSYPDRTVAGWKGFETLRMADQNPLPYHWRHPSKYSNRHLSPTGLGRRAIDPAGDETATNFYRNQLRDSPRVLFALEAGEDKAPVPLRRALPCASCRSSASQPQINDARPPLRGPSRTTGRSRAVCSKKRCGAHLMRLEFLVNSGAWKSPRCLTERRY